MQFYTNMDASNYHSRKVNVLGGTLVNDGAWHHAVATLSGGGSGSITLYVDGVSQPLTTDDLGTVTTYTSTANIWIG
jgi:hypothetical protein